MKVIISIVLILIAELAISQTNKSDFNVSLEAYPPFEKLTVIIKSGKDSLNHCNVQIIDSKKNIVKMVNLPSTLKQIENNISIADLDMGNYTCKVYDGKEELYTGEFFKDAIFSEPHIQPTPYHFTK